MGDSLLQPFHDTQTPRKKPSSPGHKLEAGWGVSAWSCLLWTSSACCCMTCVCLAGLGASLDWACICSLLRQLVQLNLYYILLFVWKANMYKNITSELIMYFGLFVLLSFIYPLMMLCKRNMCVCKKAFSTSTVNKWKLMHSFPVLSEIKNNLTSVWESTEIWVGTSI